MTATTTMMGITATTATIATTATTATTAMTAMTMAEFAYNNAKNASTGYTPFELNCGYYPHVSYEEDLDFRSRSKAADELADDLRNFMTTCRKVALG